MVGASVLGVVVELGAAVVGVVGALAGGGGGALLPITVNETLRLNGGTGISRYSTWSLLYPIAAAAPLLTYFWEVQPLSGLLFAHSSAYVKTTEPTYLLLWSKAS